MYMYRYNVCMDSMYIYIYTYNVYVYMYILYHIHDILHVTKYLRAPLKASLVHSLSPEN